MRLKPKFWLFLSLLFFAAALWLWQAGDRLAASRHISPVSSVPSVPLIPSVPAPAAAPRAYRLSNTPQTIAQLQRNRHAILLRNALIDTTLRVSLAIPEPLRSHGAPGSYLVQSDRPLNKEFYAALRQDGAEFVSYIPNNTALVRATAEAARTMVADRVFQAVLPYEPYFKLDDSLLPAAVNGELLTNNQLRVTVLPGEDAAAAQALAGLGASVTGREPAPFGSTTFFVTAPPDKLAAVAQLPQTQEIESFSPRHMLNDLTRERLGVAVDSVAMTNFLGLTGTNIWVVLDDTGVDSTHKDFAGAPAGLPIGTTRLMGDGVEALTDPNGHGTHVAATIAGGGYESYTVTNPIPGSVTPTTNLFRGMAPQASLYVQLVDLWSGPFISDAYLQSNASFTMTTNGAMHSALLTNGFINNLSWGYQSTSYDLAAASYDQATRNSQPGTPGEHSMLFVVAAGNGSQATGSITSPATAKNVITVGAIDSPRYITNTSQFEGTTFSSNAVAPFSSAGNVGVGLESAGGRFKPDVVAPGCFTISARATGFQDPMAQEVLNYSSFPAQTLTPGQSNVYAVTLLAGTTNLVIQVLPNELSPVPFPTNLEIYYDNNDPPQTLITATNQAGLPVVLNPPAGDGFVMVYSPTNQPWPVAYDLRVYAIQTNNDYLSYYQVLKTNLNANLLPYYRYESGTSMSAAAVSGMLALMQQYLHSTLKLTPSPALLKALLINGARPLNQNSDLNPTPGVNLEGYGLPNLANSIPASLSNASPSMKFYDQSNALQTGEWHNYTVNLAATDPNATNYPLRITLVWTDPPGNPAAGLALVNDLDLVVTDSTTTNVYIGNDFQVGDIYTEVSNSTNLDASDTVNNVKNVFIDATYGLLPPYTISVRGIQVNVNADTTQTNIIGQDYALVISSDDATNGLTVTDNGTNQQPPAALITDVNNGMALLHQRVGANEPNLNEYPGSLYPAPGNTNGSLTQWHFFLFPNINYNLTNTTAFLSNPTTNSDGTTNASTNNAAAYTNAIFATFLPATLTIPNSSPVNLSYPAAQNADIDLYVSTNPALFDLDPAAVSNASKSLGQGGSETVLFTNIASVPNFYIGVKCESQQGADFDFFATLTTNFGNGLGSLYGNEPITVSAYALPTVIPDSFDSGGPEGANVLAFVASPIMVRKVMVTLGIEHQNPADLFGTLSHGGQDAVLNHYTGPPGGFTNTYDDEPDGTTSIYPIVPSDAPGTLQNFIGLTGTGQWLLNEQDSVFTQTGMVTMLTLTIFPQPPPIANSGGLDYTNTFTLDTNASYYGYVDVPDDATNLNIAVFFTSNGPVGVFLTNQPVANTGDYGTNVSVPGEFLNLGTNPPPLGPPLSGGRWYYDITNESGLQMTITTVISILESGTPNLALTEFSTATPTPLATDAHTISQICVTNGILSSNQVLASLQVGVCIADPGADNLVLHLISPQGTSTLLFEDRGGPLATNLGLVATNGNHVYFTFTDNTNLGPDLVKFFPPPFGQLLTNVDALVSSFETVTPGDYGLSNGLLPDLSPLGTNLGEGWTVLTNDVAVVTGSDLYQAGDGANYLALADGLMTTTIPTVVGQPYTLTFDYRGPGLLDWWPLEGDANDIIGTNNGTITPTLTSVPGMIGQAFQFDGANSQIDFGPVSGNVGANDFTIDFWMNTTNTNAIEIFLSKRVVCNIGSELEVRVGYGVPGGPGVGVLQCGLRDDGTPGGVGPSGLVGNGKINDGQWHHVAWERRANPANSACTLLLYVDGMLNATANNQPITFVTNSVHLLMGQGVCVGMGGASAYSGAANELDIWDRALTDVEIAAIYQAGTNHIGKDTPVSILPNCQILVTGGSNTITNILVAPASGTNWLTNTVYFTAVNSNTAISLQGNPLGMLFDDFVLQTPANLNYVQPEEPLAPLTGQNPYGCWTLDVWDTRTDSTAPTNGVLFSWNLQMTVSSTNASLIVLTNHILYAGSVAAGTIAYFGFDVPANVMIDTNSLFAGTTNLNLLFNQTALPTGNGLGDYTLLTNVPSGTNVLATDTPPPSLLPGARYFLGVQNTNSVDATFDIQIDTQIVTDTNLTILLADAVPYTNTITSAPQYYSFVVPPGAVLASFDIINPTNELDLYARHTLPLPSDTTFDYQAAYDGTNDEAIVVITNSAPVPLTPGIWYLAVYNPNTNTANTYQIVATYIPNGGITIIPLIDSVPTSGTAAPGPAVTTFYSYSVTDPAAVALQFSVGNMTGDVDLIARIGDLPTPQQMTGGSFNAGTNAELIIVVTNTLLPSLDGTTWYLGVPNNTASNVSFFITATTLTNAVAALNFPAVAVTGMNVSATGFFTLNWSAVPGAQYGVNVSSNLIQWINATNIATPGSGGIYKDPTPINQQAARFYQVIRTR